MTSFAPPFTELLHHPVPQKRETSIRAAELLQSQTILSRLDDRLVTEARTVFPQLHRHMDTAQKAAIREHTEVIEGIVAVPGSEGQTSYRWSEEDNVLAIFNLRPEELSIAKEFIGHIDGAEASPQLPPRNMIDRALGFVACANDTLLLRDDAVQLCAQVEDYLRGVAGRPQEHRFIVPDVSVRIAPDEAERYLKFAGTKYEASSFCLNPVAMTLSFFEECSRTQYEPAVYQQFETHLAKIREYYDQMISSGKESSETDDESAFDLKHVDQVSFKLALINFEQFLQQLYSETA